MASAAVKTVAQLCVIRFFLGLAEASTYSGAIYIMGAWYKPDEIAKRTALFTASGQVGTMFAGVMMAAIHKGMEGMGSLGGWQWVFLIGELLDHYEIADTSKLTIHPYRRDHHLAHRNLRLPLLS
jgi:ACS family pantothenate transporter-like MFS transporter